MRFCPALTEENSPDGGVAWPETLPSASSLEPQQATAPPVLTPQVWLSPALTEENSPDGGVAWPETLPSTTNYGPRLNGGYLSVVSRKV